MQIGSKIYYDKATGNVLVNTGDRSGDVIETTQEQDFAAYKVLSERNPETVGVIQLEYRQFEKVFDECSGYRINLDTLALEFSYPDPNAPNPEQPVFQKPLTEQLAEVKTENQMLKSRISDVEMTITEILFS